MKHPMIRELPAGRTILQDEGKPILVTLKMRASTTVPSRVKAILVVESGEDGLFAALPFAAAGDRFTPEFRLEMN